MKQFSLEQLREWSRSSGLALMITPDGQVNTAPEGEAWTKTHPEDIADMVTASLGEPAPANRGPASFLLCAEGYETLASVLQRAFEQAASGKGRERHANGRRFDHQPMTAINEMLGSVDGFIYQAIKKAVESKRLPPARAVAELLGAINYLAGGVLYIERHQSEAANDSSASLKAHG